MYTTCSDTLSHTLRLIHFFRTVQILDSYLIVIHKVYGGRSLTAQTHTQRVTTDKAHTDLLAGGIRITITSKHQTCSTTSPSSWFGHHQKQGQGAYTVHINADHRCLAAVYAVESCNKYNSNKLTLLELRIHVLILILRFMPMLRFVNNLALCQKSLWFSSFALNLCASRALSKNLAVLALSQKAKKLCALLKIFAVLALCPKSLCFSRFV